MTSARGQAAGQAVERDKVPPTVNNTPNPDPETDMMHNPDAEPGTTLDFRTVPAGEYLVRVGRIERSRTRAGHPRIGLALEVVEGPHLGRRAAWDALVLSARGRHRACMVLRALGAPVLDDLEQLDPQSLLGRQALVEVQHCEYPSTQHGGRTVHRCEVAYSGWKPAPQEPTA